MSNDIREFFTEKASAYDRFVSLLRYRQGLHAYWVKSGPLADGLRVLEAGCGTGMLSLAFLDALQRRGYAPQCMHAFDLTPAMIERLQARLGERGIGGVQLREANVLELDALPESWTGYDLAISASMLEYIPRDRFVDAIGGLRARLKDGGVFVLFITRENWLMRKMIGGPWRSNLYTRAQLQEAFENAGFTRIGFGRFPLAHIGLRPWGHIVVAEK